MKTFSDTAQNDMERTMNNADDDDDHSGDNDAINYICNLF